MGGGSISLTPGGGVDPLGGGSISLRVKVEVTKDKK